MNRYTLFLLCLILSSCADLKGVISSGYYTSAGNEFKVKTPAIPKMSARDGVLNDRVFVDFYQSRGYWKQFGLYSIEFYQPKIENFNDKVFYHYNKNAIPELVKKNFGDRGIFNLIDTRKQKINDHVAYQFVANGQLDNVDAVWVGTSIKVDKYIAIISVVINTQNSSSPNLHGDSVQANIPWQKYNSFLYSFRKLAGLE